MSRHRRGSSYLGEGGPKYVRALILLLNLSLLVALVWLAWTFWRLQDRLPLEDWQLVVFAVLFGVSFLGFAYRTLRLVRGFLSPTPPENGSPPEGESRG